MTVLTDADYALTPAASIDTRMANCSFSAPAI